MNDARKRGPSFLARYSGDQIAVAGIGAALILLLLLLASALIT
jgi:hypothetical protein